MSDRQPVQQGTQRPIEVCEFNPVANRAAYPADDPGMCERKATLCVGAKGTWHLCEQCASLPRFKRLLKTPLRRAAHAC